MLSVAERKELSRAIQDCRRRLQKKLNNAFPDNNPNKIAALVQSIVIKFQLYGQAAHQCFEITKERLRSSDSVNFIVHAVYRHDSMPVNSDAIYGFSKLLNICRALKDLLKRFETQFSAAVSWHDSFMSRIKLLQGNISLILLKNTGIKHSQRVSAFFAAAANKISFTAQSVNNVFLSFIT